MTGTWLGAITWSKGRKLLRLTMASDWRNEDYVADTQVSRLLWSCPEGDYW